jgi:uncharacterized protein YecT (DUF1311 family)
MRTILLVLAFLPALAIAQTTPQPSGPQKVLTPDQAAYQAALKSYNAQADRLRARAKAALNAEVAREAVPPCPNAVVNVEIDNCMARENHITTANLKAFTAALRELLALPEPRIPGMTYPIRGPSGPEGTPATNTAAFDKTEAVWQPYAKAECDAEDVEWRGGTIVNFMDAKCELRQSRARLHELREAYDMVLEPN